MRNYNFLNRLNHSLVTSLLATVLLVGSAQAEISGVLAGEIIMLVGQSRATSAAGEARPLKKGDSVYVGDKIETGKKCYIKFRYTDGGTVLLRPDTVLVIDAYQDTGDGKGESVSTLLKGGLRSVTGAISTEKKQNYKVNTPVATLGIRGTDFVMRLCQEGEQAGTNDCENVNENGLYTSTNDGGTKLKNGGGELDSDSGEHAYVKDFDVPPIQLKEAPRIISVDNLPNPLDDSPDFIPGNACGG